MGNYIISYFNGGLTIQKKTYVLIINRIQRLKMAYTAKKMLWTLIDHG